ncbi:MAG: hypothetical protein KJ964_03695 [Verrucomicrobia bacterium]|nr:hypothetical protein [Verrucomicrobiota bacterium]MBU1734912.1 hypothetical protein [Verrucomicrobiota bacterium]MBU1857706.1 hypothetical protein [Verrucomicrobiota bacterium]
MQILVVRHDTLTIKVSMREPHLPEGFSLREEESKGAGHDLLSFAIFANRKGSHIQPVPVIWSFDGSHIAMIP